MSVLRVLLGIAIVVISALCLHVLLCAAIRLTLASCFGRVISCWIGGGRDVRFFRLAGVDCFLGWPPTGSTVAWIPRGRRLLRLRLALIAAGPLIGTIVLMVLVGGAYIDATEAGHSSDDRRTVFAGLMVAFTLSIATQLFGAPHREAEVFSPVGAIGATRASLDSWAAVFTQERIDIERMAAFRAADGERLLELSAVGEGDDLGAELSALVWAGFAHWLRGDLATARATLVAAQGWFEAAVARSDNGLDGEQIENWRTHIAINLAFFCMELGEVALADHVMEDTDERYPSDEGYLRTRGRADVACGRVEEGIAKLTRALCILGGPLTFRSFSAAAMSDAELSRGRVAAAERWCNECRRLWPRSPLHPPLRARIDAALASPAGE